MSAELLSERRAHTLLLTLSDPAARNALSPELYAAGVEALSLAESDADIRCVILTGAAGHFSAGGNLSQMQAVRGQPDRQQARVDALHRWIEALRACPKPVIAAVEGAAAGAGCSLALACDLLVASREAKFSLAYGRIGTSPDGGASWHLARLLPRNQALEWIWLAQTRSAEDLHRSGLVNRLCAPGEALTTALALADELAVFAPNVLATVKDLAGSPSEALSDHLTRERNAFVDNVNHANGGEGLLAWREKRSPRFS